MWMSWSFLKTSSLVLFVLPSVLCSARLVIFAAQLMYKKLTREVNFCYPVQSSGGFCATTMWRYAGFNSSESKASARTQSPNGPKLLNQLRGGHQTVKQGNLKSQWKTIWKNILSRTHAHDQITVLQIATSACVTYCRHTCPLLIFGENFSRSTTQVSWNRQDPQGFSNHTTWK